MKRVQRTETNQKEELSPRVAAAASNEQHNEL